MAIQNDETFIAALPSNGYQLLLLASNNEIVDQLPVLAFLVYTHSLRDKTGQIFSIYPVTAEFVHDLDQQEYLLLRPDGKVNEPMGQTWSSIEMFEIKRSTA